MRHHYYKNSQCGRVTLNKVLNNYGQTISHFKLFHILNFEHQCKLHVKTFFLENQ